MAWVGIKSVADILYDVLGLVIGEVVSARHLDGLPHHLAQGVRILDLTAKFSRFHRWFCSWHPQRKAQLFEVSIVYELWKRLGGEPHPLAMGLVYPVRSRFRP